MGERGPSRGSQAHLGAPGPSCRLMGSLLWSMGRYVTSRPRALSEGTRVELWAL